MGSGVRGGCEGAGTPLFEEVAFAFTRGLSDREEPAGGSRTDGFKGSLGPSGWRGRGRESQGLRGGEAAGQAPSQTPGPAEGRAAGTGTEPRTAC